MWGDINYDGPSGPLLAYLMQINSFTSEQSRLALTHAQHDVCVCFFSVESWCCDLNGVTLWSASVLSH